MDPLSTHVAELEAKAQAFQKESKYKQCMDVYHEILTLKKNAFGQQSEQCHRTSYKLSEICNLVSMIFLQKQKFDLCLMFLKKAEMLSLSSNHHKAITYNNLACYYRRIKKYRSALTYLENALALQLKLQQIESLADTHLNLCAVLSQLGRHTEALQHILMSIVMLQEELLGGDKPKNSERMPVLAIAYHNMGVELQYLKRYEQSISAYQKAVKFGVDHIGPQNHLVENLKNVLFNAKETIEKLKKPRGRKEATEKMQRIKGLYGDRPVTGHGSTQKTRFMKQQS